MCGLVGIFASRGQGPVDRALLRRMNDRILHRGPDGDGEFFGPGIGLGHRRLAIIDVGGGHQPLFNEDGSVVVVFNGEIYNYQGLVTELEACGHAFHTRSDTEVIVHAWEEWGPDCVTRFRGMFAFALWDANRETLFIARDRLGKKPLYYAGLSDGTLVFGSELKALLAHPGVATDLDPLAVDDYFAYGYVPDPRSIYRAVAKLPAAHRLVWRRGGEMKIDEYWRLRMDPGMEKAGQDYCEELRDRLAEAVRLRLISDVPLGAFLSGGVDSSGIVALMARQSDRAAKTFSISFGDKEFDESAYARMVADRYHTDHLARTVSPDCFDLIDRLAAIYDEPFGDSSALPTFRVCAMAREGVTVALSGDGGDELFGGYRRYAWHCREERLRALLPSGLRKPLFGLLGQVYPKLDWAPKVLRAKTTFQELGLDSAEGYFHTLTALSDDLRAALYSPAFKRMLQGYHPAQVVGRHMAAAGTDDPLLQAQYADMKTWLSGRMLVKVDRASMANSLEVRSPLLDHDLAEWAARLPPDLKLQGGEGKYVLKRALEPLVPHDVLYRPKRGFSIPIARWFRGPLRGRLREAVEGPALAATGFFDMAVLTRMVDQHQSGQRDHSAALWVVLMFESFLRHAGQGPAPATMPGLQAVGS